MMLAAGERTDGARTERPRFRQDLFAEVVEESGARFIDVMDPDSGNLFRFYEVEFSLACGMDGERDVAGIVKWAQDELGLSPSANEVRQVIATLGDLGFIDTGSPTVEVSPELAAGVVSAPIAAPVAAPEVPLGAAGASAPAPVRPEPPAPEVALGAPGTTSRKPAEPVGDVPLGAPGRSPARPTPRPTPTPDMSLNLSDHIEVRPSDVKEAVRASKIMPAVELAELGLEDKPVSRPPASRPPEPAHDARHEAATVEAPPLLKEALIAKSEPTGPHVKPTVEARPEPKVAPAPTPPRPVEPIAPPVAARPAARPVSQPIAKPPVELPKPPVVAEKTPVAPPAPKRTSPVLVLLLILVVLGGGGFLIWKYVLQGDASPTATTAPTTAPAKPAEPAPPAAPVVPTAKIALVAPPADDIKVAKAGTVENILAQTQVKAGDALVRLVGDRPLEAQLDTLRKELGKLRDQLDAATKKRDAAAPATRAAADADVAARQKALDAKQAQISAKQGELDSFVIVAAADGAFSPQVANNQKVAADDVVAKLQRDAVPSATFKVPDPKAFTAGAQALVVAKDQKVSCTVAEVGADSVKVTCPAEPSLTDGADVTLELPGAPAAPPPVAPTDTPPAAGSGDPAAGSAK